MSLAALYQLDPAPAIQRLLCGRALDLPMAALSVVGEGWFLALLAFGLAWRGNADRREAVRSAVRFLAILAATGVLVQAIKHLVDAPRPLQLLGPERVRVLLEPYRRLSFPSGHAASVAALALWASREPSARARRWPWVLAFLCGVSRVYVGAHWMADVVAGWALGAAVAAGVCRAWPPLPRPATAPAEPSAAAPEIPIAEAFAADGTVRALLRPVRTTPLPYALVMAAYFLVALNFPFGRALLASMGGLQLGNFGDALLVFAAVYALLFLCFFLTAWSGLDKPFAYVLLLTAAPASCAILNLNTEFTPLIIRSVFRTDLVEVRSLLSPGWFVHFLVLGVLPCVLLRQVALEYPPVRRLVVHKVTAVGATLVAAALLYLPNQLFFNSFADNATNHHLKSMVVPFNYVGGLAGYLGEQLEAVRPAPGGGSGPGPPAGEGLDARRGRLLAASGKGTVVVLVIGESARARSFSLNGYARETNPRLRKQGVVSFTRFVACATATAQAVPCIFLSSGERGFSFRHADAPGNLLDLAQHAGYQVTWYENGMGTQGVTRRVTEVNLGSYYRADRDRILIDRLPTRAELVASGKDHLIVLHQRGSHGPDYAERYTPEFRVFTPDCDSSVLKSCTHEAVVNAYDNSILYTDGNLDDAIEWLKRLGPEFNTALLFTSDHGESTGEDGWYMHGLPKAIAPDDQIRVPFIAWFSPGLQEAERLDVECVRGLKDGAYSHDNVFHSTLGLLDVESSAYDASRDVFRACRGQSLVAVPGRSAARSP